MNKAGRILVAYMLGVALLLPLAGPAAGQATDLACTGCVNSKNLKNKGVKRRDVARNAINSSRVANDSLKGKDIRDASLTGADIADGSIGIEDLRDDLIAHLTVGDLVVADKNAAMLGPVAHGGGVYFRTAAGSYVIGAVARNGFPPPLLLGKVQYQLANCKGVAWVSSLGPNPVVPLLQTGVPGIDQITRKLSLFIRDDLSAMPVAVSIASETVSFTILGGPIGWTCVDVTVPTVNASAVQAHAAVELSGFESPFQLVPGH